jgi:hypothetical protein
MGLRDRLFGWSCTRFDAEGKEMRMKDGRVLVVWFCVLVFDLLLAWRRYSTMSTEGRMSPLILFLAFLCFFFSFSGTTRV